MLTPTIPLLLLLVACFFALRPVARILYHISPFHPLASYPGPLLWRASRLPWTIALQRGTLHQHLLRIHDQYGSIVRIAPDELSYTDAQAWHDIYMPQPPSALPFERTKLWFRPVRPSDPSSVMGADETTHARCRRAFMNAFTDRALTFQTPIIEANVSKLLYQLKLRAEANETVDLVTWLNCLTFDISGALSFGETFGSLEAGTPHPWVAINLNFGKGVAMLAGLNMLGLSNGPIGKLLPYIMPKAVREKMRYHRALASEKVQQKLEAGANEKRADWFDALIRHNETAKQAGRNVQVLATREMEINMTVMIFAGSETVSSALGGILNALLQNPDALINLTHEVRSTLPKEEDITALSVAKLPCLNACISEGMRIHPAVPYSVPRVVAKGGAEICGRWVAEGTLVALNHLPAYHSPTNFPSPPPHIFSPSRFLSSPTSNHSNNPNPIYEPFLVGRHSCIGSKFAWHEMRLVLARLVWAFDFLPAEEGGEMGVDWLGQKTHIFWEKTGLKVRLRMARGAAA